MEKTFIDLANPDLNFELSNTDAVSRLLSGLANRINNTMASILGIVNLTEVLVNTEQGKFDVLSTLQQVNDNIETMTFVTQRLMIFSKKSIPVKKRFRPSAAIDKAVRLVFQNHREKAEIHIDKNVCEILGDEFLISEMVYNLLENAKEAVVNKGRVFISCSFFTPKEKNKYLPFNSYVRIKIKDTGVGVRADFKSRIFEPFVSSRADAAGLGLSIVAQIVKKHNGAISVDSKEKEYTEISVYLPTDFETEHTSSLYYSDSDIKILFVDDNSALRDVTYRMVNLIGLHCDTAEDSQKALELLRKQSYSLIILDLFLDNNEKGYDFLKQVKEIQPQIKSILSSGFTNHEVMANYQEYGFDGILKKPFSLNELKSLFASLFQSKIFRN